MTFLEIDDVKKTYGVGREATPAIADISLTVEEGEFVCVVGPSGCGKTTLLKIISGLLPPTSGEVRVAGKPVNGPPRGLALVFQDYSRSLFPWLTVRKNIALPLLKTEIGRAERRMVVAESASAVGLSNFLDKYPWQLSGGMQQRVAIARAIASRPRLLVMDEPFASVDAQTRNDLEDLVLRVWDQYRFTVLFVTHDIGESVYLGDRVAVLTRPPTRIEELVRVDLPRPRDQVESKALPEYADLSGHIYRLIKQMGASAPVDRERVQPA